MKLKTKSVHSLLDASLHPYQQIEANRPKIWARGDRHVYLSTDEDIDRSVKYVQNNPPKHGFKPQRWSFVTPS